MIRVALVAMCVVPLFAQPVTIGEHVPRSISTQHPYIKPDSTQPIAVMKEYVYHPQATYIALHFKRFDLAPGDFVVVRSLDGDQHRVYGGEGRHNLGTTPDGFFATHVKGDTAVIEFYNVSGDPGYGFDIDFYGRGYSDQEIQWFWDAGLGDEMNLPEPVGEHRSVCTTDDTREVKCYQVSEPMAYDKARSVARLMLNGSAHCTGWLIGCEGHVMTNEHCIGSQSELNNIDFEFMAEGPDCATNCASSLACPGTVEASGGTLVQVDAPLDFALVIPDTSTGTGTDLPATYGYMQLRDTGAVLNEQIYIVQHPAGWGKRLAFESTYPADVTGFASVVSLNEAACSGGPGDVGYWADTQGGSSGSPVLGYSDHRVVALHHCRGSGFCSSGGGGDDPNRGVPIEAVIASLGANLPNCAVCQPPNPPSGLGASANGDNQIDLSWTVPTDGVNGYNIYRAFGACPQTNWELLVSDHPTNTYSDLTVSGGTTYAYKVTTFDSGTSCESTDSNCSDATATGLCLLAPDSPGNLMAVNAQTTACEIDLSWDPAVHNCGSTVVYNIYRSETTGFVPGIGNLLTTVTSGTNYADTDVMYATDYFYIVRAEDDSGNGSGPYAGGNEDGNTNEVAGVASGPDATQFEDDVESGPAAWTLAAGPTNTSVNPWGIVSTNSHSPTQSWFVSDESIVKDQMLITATPIAVTPGAPTVLEFWHRINSEANWDGGVLEYSVDGGANWFDILDGNGGSIPANAGRFIANGYTGTLNSSSSTPFGGRMAWSGDNTDWELVQVDLADFGGESTSLRWRFGCDGSVSDEGWYVDDIRVFFGSSCDMGFCDFPASIAQWPQIDVPGLINCMANQGP